MTDLDHWATLVRRHDLTYDYSDDHRAWCKGRDERQHIMSLFNGFDDDTKREARAIWNANVERCINPAFAVAYMWKEPTQFGKEHAQ
jgi:hypothetical protein